MHVSTDIMFYALKWEQPECAEHLRAGSHLSKVCYAALSLLKGLL